MTDWTKIAEHISEASHRPFHPIAPSSIGGGCINTAVKHYKLIDRFELQNYSLKRKITEKVNPPKIRYLTREEEIRLLSALEERDKELKEKRARYVEWQSGRNHKKRRLEPYSEQDYPDHVTPIVVIAYHTGFDIGDIFDLHWEHVDFAQKQRLLLLH